MADDYAITIEAGDSTDEVSVPADALDALTEDGTPAETAGDLVMLGLAQQLHGAVHHGHGDVDDELEAAEADLMEDFEERFGVSFGEMTGHSH